VRPAIDLVKAYQEQVPLSRYDDYRDFIRRIARGDLGILTREPVTLFEPSSGSTAAAKWIPFTATLQAEIRRAVAPWMADLYLGHRRLLGGPAYWSISPATDLAGSEKSVLPVGFADDSSYLGGSFQSLVEQVLAVPAGVSRIPDVERFRFVSLLYLLARRELRFISIWHPSFLHLLLDFLEQHWEELLRTLASGTQEETAGLVVPPQPGRARELGRLDPHHPEGLWPRLQVVSCWGDGHARHAAKQLRERLGGVEVQPKGLIATEAFVTLPFQGSQVLAVTSHFFEFLNASGVPHQAHELEVGGEYSVVVTTGGGLYRYCLQDRVRVTGFLRATPCLGFLGKQDRISDLRGEKLEEGFVAGVLERVLEAFSLAPAFALLAPDSRKSPPGYCLYLELTKKTPSSLGARLETELLSNPHYAYCRKLGQLARVRVIRISRGAFARYARRLCDRGQRLGNIKAAPLSVLDDWGEWLQGD
jgi:hypothetical protein